MNIAGWFKHAFAVESVSEQALSREQTAIVELVCREVSERHLTAPALLFLEMARPLNFLGANTMHFFSPIISAIVDAQGYQCFATFLERRDAIDILCKRLEEMETQVASTTPKQ